MNDPRFRDPNVYPIVTHCKIECDDPHVIIEDVAITYEKPFPGVDRSMERFFMFIRECGTLLGKSDAETALLVDDPSWFFCFDDGLTPAEAVAKYKASQADA